MHQSFISDAKDVDTVVGAFLGGAGAVARHRRWRRLRRLDLTRLPATSGSRGSGQAEFVALASRNKAPLQEEGIALNESCGWNLIYFCILRSKIVVSRFLYT